MAEEITDDVATNGGSFRNPQQRELLLFRDRRRVGGGTPGLQLCLASARRAIAAWRTWRAASDLPNSRHA
jgi:hypothetical protein